MPVGKTRALIEMSSLITKPRMPAALARVYKSSAVVGSRSLAIARAVAIRVLMRMQVDAAVLDGGVGDDGIAQLHRGPAAATFAASLTGRGTGTSLPTPPLLPANQRREREHGGDHGGRRRDEPMLTCDIHAQLLRCALLRGREVRVVDVPPNVQPVHGRAHGAESVGKMRRNEEDVADLGGG